MSTLVHLVCPTCLPQTHIRITWSRDGVCQRLKAYRCAWCDEQVGVDQAVFRGGWSYHPGCGGMLEEIICGERLQIVPLES